MTRYLLLVILAMGVSLGATGLVLKRQITKNGAQAVQIEALQAAQERAAKQRKKDMALLARRAAENRAAARESASVRAALDAALHSNRKWADQPVPQEVQDVLAK